MTPDERLDRACRLVAEAAAELAILRDELERSTSSAVPQSGSAIPRTSYSVAEFAEMEGVTPSAVYHWIKQGELDFIERSGRLRIPARVVNDCCG